MKNFNALFNLLLFHFLNLIRFALSKSFNIHFKRWYEKRTKLLFAFLSFFLFLNLSSYAESEPNNDCTNANAILTAGLYAKSEIGTSSSVDQDFFSFDIPANGELNVTIRNTETATRSLSYSSPTTTCPSFTSGTLGKGQSITLTVSSTSAAKYYIYVLGTGTSSTDYNVSALFTPNIPTAGTDLKITKTGSTDTVLIYDKFYYTINISNIGDTNASTVVVKDSLPLGVKVDTTLTNTTSPDWNCTGETVTTTCTLTGDLRSGLLSSFNLYVSAPPTLPATDGHIITNEANVTCSATDVDTINNTAKATTTITADIDTAKHLCYTENTDLTKGSNAADCEQKGNFYYGDGCDASVSIQEVNATQKLSDIKVYKMYAPNTSSGTCAYTATTSASASASPGDCKNDFDIVSFGSYTEGYAVNINETDVDNIVIKMEDKDTDNSPRIDGIAMFGDYWTEDGFHHSGRIFDCNGSSEGSIEIISSADVIDTQITASNVANYNDNTLKYIRTMIASSPTRDIVGVHLNLDGEATPYQYLGTVADPLPYTITPYLTDNTCSATFENIIDPATNQQLIIDVPSDTYSATRAMIVSNTVRKNARIQMIFIDPNGLSAEGQQCLANSSTTGNFARIAQCVNSDVQYKTAFGQDAWDRCGIDSGKPCLSSNHGEANILDPSYNPLMDHIYTNELGCYMCTFNIQPACSSDNFAIRPKAFDVNITSGTTFVAGKTTNLKFEATNWNDLTPTPGYTEIEGSSFSVDINFTDVTKTCPATIRLNPDIQFTDGIDIDDFSFSDIGEDLNFTVHEIIGSEYASVDVNDTNDSLRFITPFVVENIKITPDRFNIDANLSGHNKNNNFTYLHDINKYENDDNHSMGAALTIDIKALGADGNITRNYMETCYAKDTNLTLAWGGTNITYPGSVPLTQFLYYNPVEDNGTVDSGEGNYTLPAPVANTISITSLPIRNIPSTFPSDALEGNGTTHIEYKLNFDRKQNLVVNPFIMTLSDVNITDTDAIKGTDHVDQNTTLYYARSRSSQFFYDDVIGSSVLTPILIDVYCGLGFAICMDFDINKTSPQIKQTNDYNWWLSLDHIENDTNNDGNVTLRVGTANGTISPENVRIVSEGKDENIRVAAGVATRPLTVEIELVREANTSTPTIYTNKWLIYNPNDPILTPSPFYKVRFIGESGWAGHGDTGHVVDSNSSTKKNRRLGW